MKGRGTGPLGWLAWALVVAIVLFAVFGALNMAADGGYYGMMGTGSWGLAVAMMAVPGVILVVILLAVLEGLGGRPAAASANAFDALAARYARGELSRDEYLRIRADLMKGPSNL